MRRTLQTFAVKGARRFSRPVSVYVVDDHVGMAKALGRQLKQSALVEFLGAAADVEPAVAAIRRHHPQIVLLDITLKSCLGFEVIRKLPKPHPRFICLSCWVDPQFVAEALDVEVWGYVIKDEDFLALTRAVEAVADGYRVFSEAVAKIGQTLRPEQFRLAGESCLTANQARVLQLLSRNMPMSEVAKQCGISRGTARAEWELAQQKLGLVQAATGRYVSDPAARVPGWLKSSRK